MRIVTTPIVLSVFLLGLLPFLIHAEEYAQANAMCKKWWNDPVVQQIVREHGEDALAPKGCRQQVSTCISSTPVISRDLYGTCVREECQIKIICGKSVETLRKASEKNSILPSLESSPVDPGASSLGGVIPQLLPPHVDSTQAINEENVVETPNRPPLGYGQDRFTRTLNDFLGISPETTEEKIPNPETALNNFIRTVQVETQEVSVLRQEISEQIRKSEELLPKDTTFSQTEVVVTPPSSSLTLLQRLRSFLRNLW